MKRYQAPLGVPKLYIGIKVEKEGKVISDRYEEGHSWTRNAWNAFTASMLSMGGSGTGNYLSPGIMNVRSTGSTLFNNSNGTFSTNYQYGYGLVGLGPHNSTIGDANSGILIGTNTNQYPFALDANTLYNQILNGAGAGQMAYQAQAAPVASYNAETRKWKNQITRVFNNNSGDAITVREVGLVFKSAFFEYSRNPQNVLFAHDILDTPETVPNAAQLTVTYEIESQEFTIDQNVLEIGAAGSGGYVCGYKMRNNLESACDQAFLLIVSTKATGEHGSKKWRDPMSVDGNPASATDGFANTSVLIALGADSEIGQFCSAARTGEYNDWYIPTTREMQLIVSNNQHLPAEERLAEGVQYWTSIGTNNNYNSGYYQAAYKVNSGTGAESNGSYTQDDPHYVRLIRCIHVSEFVPAE